MKLYRVDVMDDCEEDVIITVANSKEEVQQKVTEMDWACFMFCIATEINEVDGYKIVLDKECFKNDNK